MLALGILSTRGKLVDETLEVALHDDSPLVRSGSLAINGRITTLRRQPHFTCQK
jgi:hypothetical protein